MCFTYCTHICIYHQLLLLYHLSSCVLFGSKGTFLFLADGLIFFHNYFSLIITQVLFDVVPGIKFQDAIELVGMQPLPSTTAAWKRFITISAAIFC